MTKYVTLGSLAALAVLISSFVLWKAAIGPALATANKDAGARWKDAAVAAHEAGDDLRLSYQAAVPRTPFQINWPTGGSAPPDDNPDPGPLPGLPFISADQPDPQPAEPPNPDQSAATAGPPAAAASSPAETAPPAPPDPNRHQTPAEQAMAQFQARLAQEGYTQDLYMLEVRRLNTEWDARYNSALDSYQEFDQAAANAIQRANEYLKVRRELIAEMNDPELRARYRKSHQDKIRALTAWRSDLASVRNKAQLVREKLEDMNSQMQIFELDANMDAYLQTQQHIVYEVPYAMQLLVADLDRFQQQRQTIEQIYQ